MTDYVKVEGKIIIKDVIVSNFKVALSLMVIIFNGA